MLSYDPSEIDQMKADVVTVQDIAPKLAKKASGQDITLTETEIEEAIVKVAALINTFGDWQQWAQDTLKGMKYRAYSELDRDSVS